jgi:3-oxoisoapionate decarboxylase
MIIQDVADLIEQYSPAGNGIVGDEQGELTMKTKRTTNRPDTTNRRDFLAGAAGMALGLAAARQSLTDVMADAAEPARAAAPRRRVGTVAYCYQYSLGLFFHAKRPGERWDALKYIEANHAAGGDLAQVWYQTIQSLDAAGLKRLRSRADELNMELQLHGGVVLARGFEKALEQAAALGAKVVGCSSGMLLRPDKMPTLEAWDQHMRQCEARLKELLPAAQRLGVTIGVENHLDFTVEELLTLVKEFDSPHLGVLFDVGNTVGTLDDPTEAAEALGPYVVATHYKDFAIEETAEGFRFTMVPLGRGSLRLREITERLVRRVRPDVGFAIEMMNGQQFDVKWLEDRFWVPFRDKTPRQIAATLRHIRGKRLDPADLKTQEDYAKLPHAEHLKMEQDRATACIGYLRKMLGDVV